MKKEIAYLAVVFLISN